MKISKPSPAMVVAIIALIMAMTGSAAAVVSVARFARNAGAVDGKSAVPAGASNSHAAGRLVATLRRGSLRGKIPSRYLSLPKLPPVVLGSGAVQGFGNAFDVVDNATATSVTIVDVPGLGTLTANCADQSPKAAIEDPQVNFTFMNNSGAPINLARSSGSGGPPAVVAVQTGTVNQFTYNGSNTFTLQLQKAGVNVLLNGVVRQDGNGTATAACLVYGTALRVFG